MSNLRDSEFSPEGRDLPIPGEDEGPQEDLGVLDTRSLLMPHPDDELESLRPDDQYRRAPPEYGDLEFLRPPPQEDDDEIEFLRPPVSRPW
jgi:hypothetical protein